MCHSVMIYQAVASVAVQMNVTLCIKQVSIGSAGFVRSHSCGNPSGQASNCPLVADPRWFGPISVLWGSTGSWWTHSSSNHLSSIFIFWSSKLFRGMTSRILLHKKLSVSGYKKPLVATNWTFWCFCFEKEVWNVVGITLHGSGSLWRNWKQI